jgi:hypothetical protein
MNEFRRMGPRGLDSWIATYGAGRSQQLDEICAQKDAHTARLYWFTELAAAIAEARRTERPILSLRLLGRLDEELSCANSRFWPGGRPLHLPIEVREVMSAPPVDP